MTWEVIAALTRCAIVDAMSSTLPLARNVATPPVGTLLRDWRQRRRLSQLDLAGDANVSTRHLSCVETGRALPSREMVLRLADRLGVPLRERNRLLAAAGYAPMFSEHRLDDPALAVARQALEGVLKGHEPYPALLVDRHWNRVAANRMVPLMLEGLPAALLQPPLNVLRLSLHPQGLAPRIVNLAQWRHHLLERLKQQVDASGDATLAALAEELRGYPLPDGVEDRPMPSPAPAVAMPLQFRSSAGVLSLISTITVFGTPVDITLSELALETFFPADEATAQALRHLAAPLGPGEPQPQAVRPTSV
ncbi:helix-turn-helix transcriptional regulator [Piscinibacter aquaticus]|uniref:Helix-turn-helix transcriptional regulator n=1 Tax=Piscinibacter aquaticus TaxID=392597 RepID=A0A5C6U1P9_9BURK|nr:helix-turn-helix transcriptional regulator [Piscinibacter aquaticus]